MLSLCVLPIKLAVCQLPPSEEIPSWAYKNTDFFSITRTNDELSIVCEETHVPEEIRAEREWRCLKVQGPLDFGLTGILSSLTQPLAEAKISIFAISTFDTDYLCVKKENLQKAIEVLGGFCKISS